MPDFGHAQRMFLFYSYHKLLANQFFRVGNRDTYPHDAASIPLQVQVIISGKVVATLQASIQAGSADPSGGWLLL